MISAFNFVNDDIKLTIEQKEEIKQEIVKQKERVAKMFGYDKFPYVD